MIAYLYELLVAPMVPEMWLFALIVPVFFLSGFIKGTVGMGQPATAIGLLVLFVPLHQAAIFTLLPGIFANLAQGTRGGYFRVTIKRLRYFYLANVLAVWFGTEILTSGHNTAVKMTLGVLLLIYAANGLMKPLPTLSAQTERRWATPMGAINGFFVGITAATPFPGVPYLYALGMPREQLIQSMGIMFLLLGTVLTLSLWQQGILNYTDLLFSAIAIAPSLLGLRVGAKVRVRLSQEAFRKLFFCILIGLAVYIMITTVVQA